MNLEQFLMLVTLPVLCGSILLVFYRLARGPSMPDRIIALDMIGTIGIALVTTYGIATHQPVAIDVAVVMAVILFLGTVGFAYYLVGRRQT